MGTEKMHKIKVPAKAIPRDQVSRTNPTYPSSYDDRPSLYIDTKQFPAIRNMQVGEEATFCIKVKVLNRSESENIQDQGKSRVNCDLLITEIGYDDDDKKESLMTDKLIKAIQDN